MGKRKVPQPYIPENLEYLAKNLVDIRDLREKGRRSNIDLEELQKAVKALPRKDRENVEHFWGLEGGINHSKKLRSRNNRDTAFMNMSNEAIKSLRTLFRLDYMYMYDRNIKAMIEHVAKKINRKGMIVSDLEAIKYLVAFLVILQNGPKMSFEEDPMAVDTQTNPQYSFDEYCIMHEIYRNLRDIPNESINLRIIYDLLDMLDFKDTLAIKESFCIEVPKGEIPEGCRDVETEPIYTFLQIRNFKERVFQYGPWEVADELILGNQEVISKLGEFMEALDVIRKDWSKIPDFKVGQVQLLVSKELRTLDVYDIGGLKFTDIYEIMFLYVERNLITP